MFACAYFMPVATVASGKSFQYGTDSINPRMLCCVHTGQPLLGWRVSPLQLEDLSPIVFEDTAAPGSHAAAAVAENGATGSSIPLRGGPAFYRWLRCLSATAC